MMETKELEKKIAQGAIFILPVGDSYELGCNALHKNAVDKIKEIKRKDKHKPLSIIAPSKNWIREHFIAESGILNNLPGTNSLLLKKKDINSFHWISNQDSINLKMPDSDICRQIERMNIPFVTASINTHREPSPKKVSDIKKEIIEKAEVIIDLGEIKDNLSSQTL